MPGRDPGISREMAGQSNPEGVSSVNDRIVHKFSAIMGIILTLLTGANTIV